MTDLEKSTLRTKKEAEQLQAEEQEELATAQAMANPEAQKELTEETVAPDTHPEAKPLEHHNLSSPTKGKTGETH